MQNKQNLLFKLSWLWVVIVIVASLFLAQRIIAPTKLVETNILQLLPKDAQDHLLNKVIKKVEKQQKDKIVFVLQASNKEQLLKVAPKFITKLEQFSLLNEIKGSLDFKQQKKWGVFYNKYKFQLLTLEQRLQLKQNPQQFIDKVVQALYNPFAGVSTREFENDPFLLKRDFFSSQLMGFSKFKLTNGYLIAHNEEKYSLLITAKLKGDPFDLKLQQDFNQLFAIEAQFKQQNAIDIAHTGMIFYAKAGAKSAMDEINTIGIGSIVGIILLLAVVFREFLPIGLALLTLIIAFIMAFAVTLLFFDKIHIFSLLFGISLLGISIDYCFHYMVERLSRSLNWNSFTAIEQIFSAITLGLLTSIAGYLALLMAPFPGLQQLIVFSIVGLIAAYLTVVLWYPYLAAKSVEKKYYYGQNLASIWLGIQNRKFLNIRFKNIIAILCLVIGCYGLSRAQYNDDIRQLQNVSEALQHQEQIIAKATGFSPKASNLLVTATSKQKLLERLEKLTPYLNKLKQQQIIDNYSLLTTYVPSIKLQQQDFVLQQKLYKDYLPNLKDRLMTKTHFEIPTKFKPLLVDEFLQSSIGDNFTNLWLGKIEQNSYGALVYLSGVENYTKFMQNFANYPYVKGVNQAANISKIFAKYRLKITKLIVLSVFIIYLLLWFRFNYKRAFIIILPTLIAIVFSLGSASLLGLQLNLFTLLAQLLILGIGIDYSLFFAEGRHNITTFIAITLSAITTILSFGLLALSNTNAVHSFGMTLFLGIVIAWLLAPMAIKRGTE